MEGEDPFLNGLKIRKFGPLGTMSLGCNVTNVILVNLVYVKIKKNGFVEEYFYRVFHTTYQYGDKHNVQKSVSVCINQKFKISSSK